MAKRPFFLANSWFVIRELSSCNATLLIGCRIDRLTHGAHSSLSLIMNWKILIVMLAVTLFGVITTTSAAGFPPSILTDPYGMWEDGFYQEAPPIRPLYQEAPPIQPLSTGIIGADDLWLNSPENTVSDSVCSWYQRSLCAHVRHPIDIFGTRYWRENLAAVIVGGIAGAIIVGIAILLATALKDETILVGVVTVNWIILLIIRVSVFCTTTYCDFALSSLIFIFCVDVAFIILIILAITHKMKENDPPSIRRNKRRKIKWDLENKRFVPGTMTSSFISPICITDRRSSMACPGHDTSLYISLSLLLQLSLLLLLLSATKYSLPSLVASANDLLLLSASLSLSLSLPSSISSSLLPPPLSASKYSSPLLVAAAHYVHSAVIVSSLTLQ